MAYQWMYATPLSGLSFPLTTASGTYAAGYDTAQLSSVISKDGGAWGAIGARLSGIPGNGVYSIASLSSTEMTCYSWIIKIGAASGCLDQCVLGYNLSGYAKFTDVSGLAHSLDCSGNNAILVATSAIPLAVGSGWVGTSGNDKLLSAISGLKNDVSGLPGIMTAASGPVVLRGITHANALVGLWGSTHTSAQIAVVTEVRNAQSGNAGSVSLDLSGIAAQVWNSLTVTYTSSTTMAGSQANQLAATSGIPSAVASGFAPVLAAVSGLKNDVSGLPGVLTAISGVPNGTASGFAPVLAAASSVNISSVAAQVWNSVRAGFTSANTYGGFVQVSGLDQILATVSGLGVNNLNISGLTPIMTQVSNIARLTTVSGLDQILTAISSTINNVVPVSGLTQILATISSVPSGVAGYVIDDAAALTSGTIAHTMRLMRWFAWEDLYIDKTYVPNRLYLRTDATNYSSWWSLTDNVNNTERVRGG